MKKILSCVVAMMLVLSSVLALAEAPNPGSMVLSSFVHVDPNVANEVLDALKIEDENRKIVEPALAVINAANEKLTIAENGIDYRFFLNDTELLSLAGGMNEEGLILTSSLIPGNALTLSKKTIEVAAAAANLLCEMAASLNTKENLETAVQKDYQVFSPYIEKFLNEIPSALLFGKVEKGDYQILDHSYNTMMPISIDAQILTNAWTSMISEMKNDENVMNLLNILNVSVEEIENIGGIADILPSIHFSVFAVTDASGAETAPDKCLSVSIIQPDQENALVTLNLCVAENLFDAEFYTQANEEGNGISAAVSFIPYNERTNAGGGALALDVDGKYFAVTSAVAPDDNGSAVVLSDAIYVLNSETPLITSATRIEAGEVQKLDLSLGELEAVPIESLCSEEGKDAASDLQTSVLFSGISLLSNATKAVPEVADLIEILTTSGTAEAK